jgi:hypothetical protein
MMIHAPAEKLIRCLPDSFPDAPENQLTALFLRAWAQAAAMSSLNR